MPEVFSDIRGKNSKNKLYCQNFMPTVPRDEIWKATYQTMYDSGYNEIFAEKIMERWQVFDDLTKILVAITTASSSTAAGLAIWGLPVFKQVWV